MGIPRILICFAPFCFAADDAAPPVFFNGVDPVVAVVVEFSSSVFFSSLFPTVRSLIPSVMVCWTDFNADF
jgi:hypothetical protein